MPVTPVNRVTSTLRRRRPGCRVDRRSCASSPLDLCYRCTAHEYSSAALATRPVVLALWGSRASSCAGEFVDSAARRATPQSGSHGAERLGQRTQTPGICVPTCAHVFTAFSNAGELAFAKATPAPSPPGPNVGSGKFGTPCSRMQRAFATMPACCAAEIGGGWLVPPGCWLAHACCADRNAGDCWLIPDVRSGNPPPGAGSGKFGTPCERIQSEYLTPCANRPDAAAVLLDFDAPQAPIAIPHVMAANAIGTL
jgi:hypothetical protein